LLLPTTTTEWIIISIIIIRIAILRNRGTGSARIL